MWLRCVYVLACLAVNTCLRLIDAFGMSKKAANGNFLMGTTSVCASSVNECDFVTPNRFFSFFTSK